MVEIPNPDLLDIVPLKGFKFDDLPSPKYPYYLLTKENLYLVKPTLLGTALLIVDDMPDHLDSLGDLKAGTFKISMEPIDADTVGRAVSFFRESFNKFHSEAEVLILFDPKEKKYDLFIPHQFCTQTSVKSIYDKADIPSNWMIIGTMHSHCNMGAFHSSIDVGDGSSFNGIHITIGRISSTDPEFAVMFMVNGQQYDLRKDRIDTVLRLEKVNEVGHDPKWIEMHGKPSDIITREFKSLTQEELDEWFEETLPKNGWGWNTGKQTTHLSKSEKKKLHQENKNNNGGTLPWQKTAQNWNRTRWSQQLKMNVPVDYLDQKGNIKEENFEECLTAKLEEYFDMALDYGMFLNYEMIRRNSELREDEVLSQEEVFSGTD